MTLMESLRALQSLPQQPPLIHPAFRKISIDLYLDSFEFLNYHDQLTYSLDVQNTIQAVLKYSKNKDRFNDKKKINRIYQELEALTEPYRNNATMNILFDELIRIRTAFALLEGDLRKALTICLQTQFLFPVTFATVDDLQRMYTKRKKIFQTSAEEMLFLRFLLTQEYVLTSSLKAEVMATYQTMLRHQQSLLTEPLFMEHDVLDEYFILNLYPEAEAREILALERGEPVALLQQKDSFDLWLIGLATTVAVIFVMNYFRKFIPNNSQNQRKKPVIIAEVNHASTINQPHTREVASLAEIVLDAASDYYSFDSKETLNSLISSLEKQDLEQMPLHLKKQLKDQVDQEKISKLLLRLYRDQQNAYEIAITLLGVRKDEALKQISGRCKKQMREYSLQLLCNATAKHKKEQAIIPPPPPAPIAVEKDPQRLIDKINQLFEDPLLPLEPGKRWSTYPECESAEIKFTVRDYIKNGAITRQLTELKQQYKTLKNQLTKLTEKKEEYLKASKIDLATISDVTELKQIQKDILKSQKDIKQLITQTEETTAIINDAIGRIKNKHAELSTKPIKQNIETLEERTARLALVAEGKAKRKADKQNAIQKQQRQELELETRIKGYPTGEEQEHFTRAYAALQHLIDIQHPKEQITPRLVAIRSHEKNMGLIAKLLLIPYQIMELESMIAHDAAILAMIQLHEALLKLAHSAYKSLLPKALDIIELRNYFAHQIMFIPLENIAWGNNIKACYQAYGNFVEYFNHEKRIHGKLVRVDFLPALNRAPVNVEDISFDDKKTLFAILCNRYQAYYIILNHQVEKLKLNCLPIVFNNDEIHLVMTAMRSLIVQLREVGKSTGITPANEFMAPLAGYRNQEAHLGAYTDAQTLLNLNNSVKLLGSIAEKVGHNPHILLAAPKIPPEPSSQAAFIPKNYSL